MGNTYLVEIGDVVFDNFCMSLIKKIRLKLFPLKPNRMPIDVIKPHIIVRHFWNTEPFRFHLVWFCYLSCKLVQHIAIFYVIWAYDWIIVLLEKRCQCSLPLNFLASKTWTSKCSGFPMNSKSIIPIYCRSGFSTTNPHSSLTSLIAPSAIVSPSLTCTFPPKPFHYNKTTVRT